MDQMLDGKSLEILSIIKAFRLYGNSTIGRAKRSSSGGGQMVARAQKPVYPT